MRRILRFLKRIWIFNFLRRICSGMRYYNKRYLEIIKWGFASREDTNYTYHITADSISYLAHSIAVVTGESYDQILKYIQEAQEDETLRHSILSAIENSKEKRYADKEVRFGRRLGWYALARIIKPGVIIETGVDKGLGSILLCAALLRNKEEGFAGRYYGTDINPRAGYFLTGKYSEVGEILYGDSIQSLSKFTENVDLFINDSDHSAEYEYQEYHTIKPLLTERSILLGDNSHCTSKLADFSRETGRSFIFYKETPLNHWYPGAGIGISYKAQ